MHLPAKITILNVDDYESGRYVRSRILRLAGYDVEEAANGADALRLALERQPQIVVLDVHLPDMDGFEVCRLLKANPATSATPVLHVSATCKDASSHAAGLDSGSDAYLTEPVDPEVLVSTIKALLRVRSLTAELQQELARIHQAETAQARSLADEQHTRRQAEAVADRLQKLHAISVALAGAHTSEEVLDVIVREVANVTAADVAVVALLNEGGTEFRTVRMVGYPPEAVERYRTFPASAHLPLADAVRTGKLRVLSSEERKRAYPELAAYVTPGDSRASAALPLTVNNRIIGGMALRLRVSLDSAGEEAFLMTLAHECAQALERARLFDAERAAKEELRAEVERSRVLDQERSRLLEELHAEKAHLEGIFNAIPAYVASTVGPDHVLDFSNPRNDAAWGWRTALGRPIREAYPELGDAIFELWDRVYASGEPYHGIAVPVRVAPGAGQLEEGSLNLTLLPRRSSDGKVCGVLAFGIDVTEEVRSRALIEEYAAGAERRAREAEEGRQILAALMEHIPLGIAIADAPDASIRMVSEHGRQMPERPADLPLARAIDSGEVVTGEETVLEAPEGGKRTFMSNAGPIRDAAGAITGGVAAWMDITDRKAVEDALRRTNASLWLVSEAAGQLLSAGEHKEFIGNLYRKLSSLLGLEVYLNFVVSEDGERLRLHSCGGLPDEAVRGLEWLEFGQGVCGTVALQRRRIVEEHIDESRNPVTELIRSCGIQAYACHPLQANGALIGTLGFGTRTRPAFEPYELELMQTIANQVSQAVHKSRLFDQAQEELAKRAEIEAALRASERQLRDLTDILPQHLWTALPDGSVDYCNQQWLAYAGVALEQVRGQGWGIVVHPEDTDRVAGAWSKAIREGSPYEVECRLRGADGVYRWFLGRAVPFRDEDGRIVKWFGSNTDIEARKRTEEALRESEQRLRAVLDNTTAIVYLMDAESRFVLINRQFEKLFEVRNEELRGKPVSEVFSPSFAETFAANNKKVLEAGRPLEFEEVAPLSDGPHTYISIKVPLCAADGTPFAICGISTDITDRKRAEEQLRYQFDITQAITSNAAEAFILTDAEGRVTFMNPAAEQIFGWTQQELLGRVFHDQVHYRKPDGTPFPRTECPLRHVFESGQVLRGHEDVFFRKDGTPVEVECSNAPILSEGRVAAAVLVARDISARKAAETALRESALRYSTLAEALPEILYANRPDGWNDYVSHRFYEYTGMPPGAAEGFGWAAALHPDDREPTLAGWTQSVKTGRPFSMEYRFRRSDGTYRWFHGHSKPLRDERGEVVRWLGVCMDVDDRRRAEEGLRQVNETLTAIIEHSPLPIWAIDLQGRITLWNPAAERLFGWSKSELAGAFNPTVPEDLIGNCFAILERVREGETVVDHETTHRKKDGSRFPISLAIAALRDAAGTVSGFLAIGVDLTERRDLEQQMRETQKLESIGLLAGGIAHDFNNLLTGIMGNACLLADHAPSDAAPFVERILSGTQRAADLTSQLLAYAGKGRFVNEPVHLSALIRETADLMRTSIPRRTELALELADDLFAVWADPTQIRQIVLNLVINAAEAIGDDNRGRIRVSTDTLFLDEDHCRLHSFHKGRLSPGQYVCLGVADSGCGMDAATRERMFEPFFTTKFVGRGLGLAAVAGIVRSHKGAVSVSSEPGRGSTVRVFLPATAGTKPARPQKVAGAEPDVNGAGAILVVDDEESVRIFAKAALERYGYTVLLAENGEQALEVLDRRGTEIAALVLDLTMPVMGGEEVLEILQERQPGIPLVLSSGYNETEACRIRGAHGVSEFIQKPYAPRQLAEKVKRALGRLR